jgi:hypothetical protein
MNNFKNVEELPNCNECEYDIFTLLKNDKDKDKLLTEYLESHKNFELLSLITDKVFNINYIPENIKDILFENYY